MLTLVAVHEELQLAARAEVHATVFRLLLS